VKEKNQALVMELVRTNKSISKADIARKTGLSANAVGMITSALIAKDYIYISGVGESTGGRKPDILSLKPNSCFSIGFDIDTDCVRVAKTDLSGQVMNINTIMVDCREKPNEAFKIVNSEISKEFCEKLIGVGIAVAGQVCTSEKIVVNAPNLKWQNVSVKDYIKYPVPVVIDNESVASAIYENFCGMCTETRNFICINSKSGIGAGIFCNGSIYRGANGSAGEVGHIITDVDGTLCGCGSRGCLETVASSVRICEKSGLDSIEAVVERALHKNKKVLSVLKNAAKHLGIAIVGLANTLNPEKIILGKNFTIYGPLIIEQITEFVKTNGLKQAVDHLEILISDSGENSSVVGASLLPQLPIFGK